MCVICVPWAWVSSREPGGKVAASSQGFQVSGGNLTSAIGNHGAPAPSPELCPYPALWSPRRSRPWPRQAGGSEHRQPCRMRRPGQVCAWSAAQQRSDPRRLLCERVHAHTHTHTHAHRMSVSNISTTLCRGKKIEVSETFIHPLTHLPAHGAGVSHNPQLTQHAPTTGPLHGLFPCQGRSFPRSPHGSFPYALLVMAEMPRGPFSDHFL